MPQERREKALAILASGVDEARWAEVRPRDREKRREVMAKLEAKFRSEPEKVKKLRPYTHKRLPWKVGDVLSLRLGRMCEPWCGSTFCWPFDDLYTAVLIVDIWEEDAGDICDIPVVAVYDWVGTEEAAMEDLAVTPFLRGDDWFRGTEELERKSRRSGRYSGNGIPTPSKRKDCGPSSLRGRVPLTCVAGKKIHKFFILLCGKLWYDRKNERKEGVTPWNF